jgi:histone deacetylase 1/2
VPLVPNHIPDIPHLPIDDLMDDLNQDEDTVDPDDRRNQRLLDSRVQADGELSDSDDEGEGGRKNQHSHKDDDGLVPARKFVTTTGIMNPGASAASHGAGPSAHPPSSIPTALVTADEMDVDDAPAEEPSTEEHKPADSTEKEDRPAAESIVEEKPAPTPAPPADDTPIQDKPMEDAGQGATPVAETAPPTT